MPAKPTEWIKFTLTLSRRASLVIMSTMLAATSAQSAALRLNPDDGAGNVITFDGDLAATVVQSSAGMDIIIPGVKFILDCQGEPTDTCNISVASSAAAAPSPAASAPAPDDPCAGKTGFGATTCDSGAPPPTTTTPEPATDDTPAEEPAADNSSGYGVSGSGSGDQDNNSSGGGWGIAPVAGSVTGLDREAFPASNRTAYYSSPDVGSGGADQGGNTHQVPLGLKTVSVLPLTMSSAAVSGGIGVFEPTTAPSGSDLAIWISKSQDGYPVASACAAYGGYDGKLRVSTIAGSGGCVLEPGATYYVNLAACVRGSASDETCSNGAQTGYSAGAVLVSGTW